jgi:glycosyltransferase involved in cell wall biosynthesis
LREKRNRTPPHEVYKIMLNTKSNYLVILIATYNRIELLKRSIQSIVFGTRCSFEILVIDGGSTDGTIEFLKSCPDVTPVFQGKLLGQAQACNQVWREINCKYTCWLSDDTELVPGGLDRAVAILDENPGIGMVGLKMIDTVGRGVHKGYGGAVSDFGIITCNHGVLPLRLLREAGYFNEDYHTYGIDPDLTASILCTGKTVVLTKKVNVLHHRVGGSIEKRKTAIEQSRQIYLQKFKFLRNSSYFSSGLHAKLRMWFWGLVLSHLAPGQTRFGLNRRDRVNLMTSRFIHVLDPLLNLHRPYYLSQRIPRKLLLTAVNPYKDLVYSKNPILCLRENLCFPMHCVPANMNFLPSVKKLITKKITKHFSLFLPPRYPPLALLDQSFKGRKFPDIILFGDSVMERIAKEDSDPRNLGEMLTANLHAEGLSGLLISYSAYHLLVYKGFVLAMQRKACFPKLVVISVNMRSFSPQWDLQPYWQFDDEIRILQKYYESNGRVDRLRIKKPEDIPAREIQAFNDTAVHYPLSKLQTIGQFVDVIESKPHIESEIAKRKQEIFIFHYTHPLSANHRKVRALDEILKLLSLNQVMTLVYLTPINYMAAKRFVGEEFTLPLQRNIQVIKNVVAANAWPGLKLIDWSRLFDSAYFFDEDLATEHLNEHGRQSLSHRIVTETLALLSTETRK